MNNQSEFQILMITGLKDDERDELWKQGVFLDDWDYILVLPLEAMDTVALVPVSYQIERLLTGCCNNRWYTPVFRNKKVFMGVAYHA